MREFKLTNGIKACIKKNENTPRIALAINFSIIKPEKNAGEYVLMNRLLMKGTQKYSSKELSSILDENAIELNTDMKFDYLRFRFVALNEDFPLALSILSDIIQNSTFEEFEREKIKLKGELLAQLDSARLKVIDLFTKTIFKDHFYGNSCTKILEDIDKVTLEDVKSSYKEILENSKKVLTVVGDIDYTKAENLLNEYLSPIPASKNVDSEIEILERKPQVSVDLIKEDAEQAQIIQGWLVPPFGSEDHPRLMLLNTILGASGLSSRLFLELREKKGLAYTVRTSYENHAQVAIFTIYIGTEPSNIQTSIDGFKQEIEKIKTVLISDEELQNAKSNIIGKQNFIFETNSQQANTMAFYGICGKPFDYQEQLNKSLEKVTAAELMECAQRLFTEDFVITVLKP